MGYSTKFTGKVAVRPRLNEHEITYLRRFAGGRHMDREKGPYYCAPDDDDGSDVLRGDEPGADQPGLWCLWEPTDEGRYIRWNKGEKFYESAKWMAYVIRTFLMPGAALQGELGELGELGDPVRGRNRSRDRHYAPEFEHFTFDHVCDGVLKALGDSPDDRWSLIVTGNEVFVQQKGEEDLDGPIVDTSPTELRFVQVALVGGPHDGQVHSVWEPYVRKGLRLADGTRYALGLVGQAGPTVSASPGELDEAERPRVLHFQEP